MQYSLVVNKKYAMIHIDELHDLLEDASDMIDEIFELTDPESFWFWQEYVKVAYQRGTSQNMPTSLTSRNIFQGLSRSVCGINQSDLSHACRLVRAMYLKRCAGLQHRSRRIWPAD